MARLGEKARGSEERDRGGSRGARGAEGVRSVSPGGGNTRGSGAGGSRGGGASVFSVRDKRPVSSVRDKSPSRKR